jgi:hypothetical protein
MMAEAVVNALCCLRLWLKPLFMFWICFESFGFGFFCFFVFLLDRISSSDSLGQLNDFGADVTAHFLKNNGFKYMVRGHQLCTFMD